MDAKRAMECASDTAATYLRYAIKAIDEQLGQGYAKEHPELVAAFMRAAAMDYAANWLGQELGGALHAIADA